jgi:thiol:disulfide interchange protein DsbC
MKKFILILSIFFLISCNITSNPCTKIKEDDLKNQLKKAFNVEFDKILEKNDVKGTNLCQVVLEMGGNFGILYVSPDIKTFFIGGDIYKDGVFLSKTTLNKIQEKNFEEYKNNIEKVVAFSYKPEGAQKFIYMVTDPDCPFCEKSKELVKQWAEARKVEVKVILFPLERLHPQAKEKSVKGICSGMQFKDYLNSNWSGKVCDEGLKKIEDSIVLMQKIGINGTPSFISYNGKRFVGFSPEGLDSIIQ